MIIITFSNKCISKRLSSPGSVWISNNSSNPNLPPSSSASNNNSKPNTSNSSHKMPSMSSLEALIIQILAPNSISPPSKTHSNKRPTVLRNYTSSRATATMWRTNRVNLMLTKRFLPGWWRRIMRDRVLAKVTTSTSLWPSLGNSCRKRFRRRRVSLIGLSIIIKRFSRQTFRARCLPRNKCVPAQPAHGTTTLMYREYKSPNLCQQSNESQLP